MPARTQIRYGPVNPLWLQAFFRIHYTPTEPAVRPFAFATDRFAFANETVWNYVEGEVRPQAERESTAAKRYTRHCFVMVRAAMQFWKCARFEPAEAPLPDDELIRRIRRVASRPVWLPPLLHEERVVFTGFANLHEITAVNAGLFQDHLGAAWPVYFRVGNFPITRKVSNEAKARLHQEIMDDMGAGYPTLLWLYNFPSLNINHTVLVYGARIYDGDPRTHYRVYDPNYADAPKELLYDPATQDFSFEPTFYFKGGSVTPRAVYRGFFE